MAPADGRQQERIGQPIEEALQRDRVLSIVNRRPTVGLAIGVVDRGGLQLFHGHGMADLASKEPITEATVFRIASITKTFTAVAIMQLWERGLVELDAPVSEFLHSYELESADVGFQQATVRHLLTHTAGLPEVVYPRGIFQPDFGESVKAGSDIPTLAEFYRGRLQVRAEPGTRFVYNNHGPATLGQIVEDLSGETLAGYFQEHIFEPLAMADSGLLRTDRLERRRATGYEIARTGVNDVAERDFVTAGAASVYSTPADMARYLSALLGEGSNEHGAVLKPGTMAMMFDAHYRPDPRIPGLGLAFFRSQVGGKAVVGHQGSLPGFHSQISLVPDSGIAVMAFTNGAQQADLWLPGEVSRLLRELIGLPAEECAFAHHPGVWGDVCGWYRLSAGLTDIRLRAMMGLGAEVFIRGDRLKLRFLTPIPELAAGFELHPDDEHDAYVYRIDLSDSGLDPMRIVFGQDRTGATTRLHLDMMPLTLEKQPPYTNPRSWLAGGLGVGAAATLARRLRR